MNKKFYVIERVLKPWDCKEYLTPLSNNMLYDTDISKALKIETLEEARSKLTRAINAYSDDYYKLYPCTFTIIECELTCNNIYQRNV